MLMPVNRMLTVRLAVQTQSDLELIQALDFEPELPCEDDEAIGEPAIWRARCKGSCGFTAVVCEEHRAAMARWIIAQGSVKCRGCGLVGSTLEECYEFLPIKAARDAHS